MARRRDQRGAAVVEFAMVLPVLVLFVFGIVEFGRGYNAKIELTSAVREGARTAALFVDACPPATTMPPTFDQCVETATRQAAAGLPSGQITVQAVIVRGAVSMAGPCPSAPQPGDNAKVTATYPFTYSIPLLGVRTKNLTAGGVMRCGG